MPEHYSVNATGSLEPSSATEGATGKDWDNALADARERSLAGEDYFTVRHNGPEGSRIIATVIKGELHWPRQASPLINLETGHAIDWEAGQ